MNICTCTYTAGRSRDCPVENLIKTYLVVQGIFNVLQLGVSLAMGCAFSDEKDNCGICLSICNIVLVVFLVAWTIAGSVWVWKSVGDWQNDHSMCNDALMISAMICLSLHYLVILVLCCCAIIGVIGLINDC